MKIIEQRSRCSAAIIDALMKRLLHVFIAIIFVITFSSLLHFQ